MLGRLMSAENDLILTFRVMPNSFGAMRNVFVCLIACFPLSALSPAFSRPLSAESLVSPSRRELANRQKTLDEMFGALKRQRNQVGAEQLANRIGATLAKSGSANIDLMMKWAAKALAEKKFDQALDFLDEVIALRPDYPEAVYQRATLHFSMKEFSKAMVDIQRTLELEPRHFGAMRGLAEIMEQTGREDLALRAYEQILVVYPTLRDVQNEVGRLADKLAGEGA